MNATQMTTGKVRLSYAHLFKPYAHVDGQTPKYSTTILIPKSDTVTIEKIKKAINAALETGKNSKWGGKIPKTYHSPLRDGDAEKDDPLYEGCYFMSCNANADRKPTIYDLSLNEILDPNEVYSGCYARVNINFYPYSASGNNGIAVGLNMVQKVADGDKLGGSSVSASEAFADDDDLLD